MKNKKFYLIIMCVISILFILIAAVILRRTNIEYTYMSPQLERIDTFKEDNIYITGQTTENREVILQGILSSQKDEEEIASKIRAFYIEDINQIAEMTIDESIEIIQFIVESPLYEIKEEDLNNTLSYIRDNLSEVYLNISYNKDGDTEEFIIKLLDRIEELEVHNLQIIITIDSVEDIDQVADIEGILLGINIYDREDILLLNEIRDIDNKIIINEYLVDQSVSLDVMMDDISYLYYKVVLENPNVKMIWVKDISWGYDQKIKDLYRDIIVQEWISETKKDTYVNTYQQVDVMNKLINNTLELIVWDENDKYSHIGYRLNDEPLQHQNRMPYSIKYDESELTKGINKIDIIGYIRDSEEIEKKEIYVIKDEHSEVSDRASRSHEGYDKASHPIYDLEYLPILMYHDFKDEVKPEEQSITVSTDNFRQQMERLLEEGYTPINFLDLDRYINGEGGLPEKPVIITTDDGYLSNYEIAYPILLEYDIQATYFITSQYVGVKTGIDHFTWDQAREMEESGLIDIQSHTHSHRNMSRTYEEDILYQTSHSFGRIEEELGVRDVKALAYPEFRHTEQTKELLSGLGVDLQITNLQKKGEQQYRDSLKRIHVSDDMTADDLIDEIEKLTMK